MNGRTGPSALCAAAAIGLAAAPAAAEAPDRMIEICTSRGSEWVRLPDDPAAPAGPRELSDQLGCAHVLCPRGQGLDRKKGDGRTR